MSMEIPADKAAIIERAREMEAGDWKALEGMTDAELDEWEAELEGAYVYQKGAHGSAKYNVRPIPHNKTRLDAISAVTAERSRRQREYNERSRNKLVRDQSIVDGAKAAREAVELLNRADSLDAGLFYEVPEPPEMDVARASDAELDKMAATCRDIEKADRDWNLTGRTAEMAASVAMVKTEAAERIAAELAEIAKKHADRASGARSLLDAIREEEERREHERRQAEEGRTPEAMEARIAELESRLTERDGDGK